jgi:hypothetical protein
VKVLVHLKDCFEKKALGNLAPTRPPKGVFPQSQASRHSETALALVQGGPTELSESYLGW